MAKSQLTRTILWSSLAVLLLESAMVAIHPGSHVGLEIQKLTSFSPGKKRGAFQRQSWMMVGLPRGVELIDPESFDQWKKCSVYTVSLRLSHYKSGWWWPTEHTAVHRVWWEWSPRSYPPRPDDDARWRADALPLLRAQNPVFNDPAFDEFMLNDVHVRLKSPYPAGYIHNTITAAILLVLSLGKLAFFRKPA